MTTRDDLRSRTTPDVLRAFVRGVEPLLPPGRATMVLYLAERGRLVEGFEALCDELCARGSRLDEGVRRVLAEAVRRVSATACACRLLGKTPRELEVGGRP